MDTERAWPHVTVKTRNADDEKRGHSRPRELEAHGVTRAYFTLADESRVVIEAAGR